MVVPVVAFMANRLPEPQESMERIPRMGELTDPFVVCHRGTTKCQLLQLRCPSKLLLSSPARGI